MVLKSFDDLYIDQFLEIRKNNNTSFGNITFMKVSFFRNTFPLLSF